MAKIHFLGTCSGTEPMPGMHHCSLVLETAGQYYWFDAGEGCAFTAHTSGMNVLNTRAIFVSHPHIDHIGGLANLFQCMKKLISRGCGQMIHDNQVDVYFPDMPTLQAIKLVADSGNPNAPKHFELLEHAISDGVLFQDEHVTVTALHNRHMNEDGSRGWHSYSFLMEAEGKKIVFSGDVASPDELDPLVSGGTDMLIMETGHHKVVDVCEYAASRGVNCLRFNHHGREIINDRAGCEAYVADFAAGKEISIIICRDGMIEEI